MWRCRREFVSAQRDLRLHPTPSCLYHLAHCSLCTPRTVPMHNICTQTPLTCTNQQHDNHPATEDNAGAEGVLATRSGPRAWCSSWMEGSFGAGRRTGLGWLDAVAAAAGIAKLVHLSIAVPRIARACIAPPSTLPRIARTYTPSPSPSAVLARRAHATPPRHHQSPSLRPAVSPRRPRPRLRFLSPIPSAVSEWLPADTRR